MDTQDFLFRCNPDPIWIYDRETLRFLAVNQAAVRRYGYSEAEFLAMTIADIRPAEDVERLLESVAATADGLNGGGYWRHLTKSGEILIVEVRSFGLEYQGRPAEIVTVSDITELQRLAEAEQESRRAERAALDLLAIAGRTARFGGWRIDLERDNLIWSGETAAIHGESAGVAVSLAQGLSYYVPEHRERIGEAVRRCLATGESFDEILQLQRTDGRRIWVRSTGQADRDPAGRVVGVSGGFQDIDELVSTRERFQALERRLAETLEAMEEGFMVLDADWRFVFLNRAAAEILQRPIDELLGTVLWSEFPLAVGSEFQNWYEEVRQTGRAVAFEASCEPLGWFEVRAYSSGADIAVHFRNITAQRAALADLSASEERFRLVAAVTSDVIWDFDFIAGTVWWNEHMASQFGHDLPSDARPPDFWVQHIHPEDRAGVLALVDEAIETGQSGWRSSYRFMKGDGSAAHVIDRAFIMRDADGRPLRMLGSMTDVSERVEIEARLTEGQKLEALGRLTGGVAHDFNNLLTIVMGNSETLAENLDEPAMRDLARINLTAAQQGAALVRRLLAFARQQPLEPSRVDIRALVQDLHPMLVRAVGESVSVRIVAESGLGSALVDAGQLESVLVNLAVNARDAMTEGGVLTVTVDAPDAWFPDENVAGKWIRIAVSDTGGGMSEEVRRRAFDPFFTTKPAGKGTGLGLSMVHGIVAQSNGHVRITSEPGQGACIELYLPFAEPVPDEREADVPVSPKIGCGERILLVEDDPMVRSHAIRQLVACGYEVHGAADGMAALAHLETGAPVDLLFSDIAMPGGLNGHELARAARALRPDLRILLTSGYDESGANASGETATPILNKPYRRQQLIEKVRQTLDTDA